ncbi:MAG: universal stress protein [Deltaproteobacteria bacterium]|nr:universal stress protein [Deltaproteobacteria bacterium]
MEKRILVAVDGSGHAEQALEYAVGMGSIIKNLDYVVLNVHPKISEFLLEDARRDSKARKALKIVIEKNHDNSLRILDDSKKAMLRMGVAEDRIETVSETQSEGIAKTILDYAKQSMCDAIVLGKRGITPLEESFIGSITNSVLEHTKITPIWAVGGDSPPASKIMLAIDGSQSSLRAVDHVSYMVGGNEECEITCLHVIPKLRDYCSIDFDSETDTFDGVIAEGDKHCIDNFYIHARKILEEAGIKESQINIKEVKSLINIAKTIVEEAKKDNVRTLVVGTKGIGGTLFVGSVAKKVLLDAKDCAVWLVP